MEAIVQELRSLTTEYASKFASINDAEFSNKPLPLKWSKKEVVGHLIDSGQNNLRRFIVSQYEAEPPNIVYEQNFWVQANGYQQMKKEDIIELWRQINLRICDVLENMPEENYTKESNTGKSIKELHTLQWLAADYVKHMKHHINQVIAGSFNITYP
jgi:hypothetical protein